MSELKFVAPAFIPFVFLVATWLALKGYKPIKRGWVTGLAVLLSLPIGLFVVRMIYLPPYDPVHEQNPGVGVAFVPFLEGWLSCVAVWAAVMAATLVNAYLSRNSS